MSAEQKAAALADVAQKFISAHLNHCVSTTLRVLIDRLKKLNVEMSVLRDRWGEHFSADNNMLSGLQKRVDEGPKAITEWMMEHAEVLGKMKTEIVGEDEIKPAEQQTACQELDEGLETLFAEISKVLSEMGTELNATRTVMKGEARQFAKTLKEISEAIESINKSK